MVAGLLSTLAGVGTVEVVHLVQGLRLAGAVRTCASALRLARGRALAADRPIDVRFDAVAGTVETRDGAGAVLATRWLPAGVGFVALPSGSRIRFGNLGTAQNGTVVLGVGARQRSLVVNQRGRVRVP